MNGQVVRGLHVRTAAAALLMLGLIACAGATPGGAPVAPGPTTRPAAPAASGEGVAAPDDAVGPPAGSLVVRTGELELEVVDVSRALAAARDVVDRLGGYVAGSTETDDGEATRATIVYRVPTARWDEALAGLRGVADRVVREATDSVEVTDQVVDLAARIENLQASESALSGIMGTATTVEDVLKVQARLEEVREEIERLTAQRDSLEGRAALATLAVTWTTPVVAVSDASRGWDVATEIDRALAQTLEAGQTVASFAIWLVLVGLPVLVPVGILLHVVVRLARRWIRAHPPERERALWGPEAGS